MGNEDDLDKQALEDCHETVQELKQQNAELQDENVELRESSKAFGELAERLSDELRKDDDGGEKAKPTSAARPSSSSQP